MAREIAIARNHRFFGTVKVHPDNPAVEALRTLHEKAPTDPRIAAYALLLYDQAAIAEGSKVPDAAGFAKRINDLILADAVK